MLASHNRPQTAQLWNDRTRLKVPNVSRASDRSVNYSNRLELFRAPPHPNGSSRIKDTDGNLARRDHGSHRTSLEGRECSALSDTTPSGRDGWKVLPFGESLGPRRAPFRKADRFESLERILNTTTLTTQRVAHRHILDVGKDILSRTHVDIESGKAEAVKLALQEAEEKNAQHLKAMVNRLKERMDIKNETVLEELKQKYQKISETEAIRRDRLETENRALLKNQLAEELKVALEMQKAELTTLQDAVIKESCDQLRKRLGQEFCLEKERAIADALAKARENFKRKELEHITAALLKCEQDKAAELEQLSSRQKLEMDFQQQQNKAMSQKYVNLLTYSRQLEDDFKSLEMDYMRFLDQTDKYHSDYLVKPRFPRSAAVNSSVTTDTGHPE